jgi:hypothetical protein
MKMTRVGELYRGVEIFSMEADLDPKFLNKFSTDYRYEELTPEQQEVHDLLFAENEPIFVGEEGLTDEKVELDDIISAAKGGNIKLKPLAQKDFEKKEKLEEKEREMIKLLQNEKKLQVIEKKPEPEKQKPIKQESEMDEEKFYETSEERFIRQIIGKPQKKVKFEEIDERKSFSERSEDEGERSDEDFLPPKEMPKKMDFSEEDFPHISLYNDMEPEGDDVEVEEISGEDEQDEEDTAMEAAILKEQQLEKEFKEVLKNEYEGSLKQERTKELTTKEFDSIIKSHLNTLDASKKKALSSKSQPEKKPEVVNVTSKGGGQITFYFGGAKPEQSKSKAKKTVSHGIKEAVGPEKQMAELKALMAAKAAQEGQVLVDNEEVGVEEWEDDGEEEGDHGDEEGEEEESDDEGLDPEEKYEKMLDKMQLLEKLPLCMRIERDAKLPDTLHGLKVFKKTLAPALRFKDDQAAVRMAQEEEDIDFSKPPPGFDTPSIRGGFLVESRHEPKVVTKAEAVGQATLVREKKVGGKKYKMKTKKTKKVEEPKAEEQDDESESKALDLTIPKNETEEEKKARKALIKQIKSERKTKKLKFKEKYEDMKKGYLSQNRAQTDGTQGVPVYRIT